VKNLHFPIGVSFGKDENQPGADGKVYNVAYVVSQLAPEGSLQDAYFSSAETRISLKPDEKVSILLDVATALRALHSAGAHTVRKIRLNCCGYVCTYVCVYVCMYALKSSQLLYFTPSGYLLFLCLNRSCSRPREGPQCASVPGISKIQGEARGLRPTSSTDSAGEVCLQRG
jgi:hypothetical protein